MGINAIHPAVYPQVETSPVAHAPSAPAVSIRPAPVDVERTDAVEFSASPEKSPAFEELRLAATPNGIRLQVDQSVDRVIAQILNESNEVIKQIPPEAAVRAFKRFREVTGLIFDLEI